MEVRPHKIEFPDEFVKECEISYFDFGRQYFYRWTHQAFIDEKVKAFVVIDGRDPKVPDFWLEKLLQFAPEAIVFRLFSLSVS